MTEPGWVGIVGMLAAIIAALPVLWAPIRNLHQARSCKLEIPGPGDTAIKECIIPELTSEFEADVRFRVPTELRDANLRFVSGVFGGNVDPEQVLIETVRHRTLGVQGQYVPDGSGGFDMHHSPPFSGGEDSLLRLLVNVKVQETWEGFLSFRWFDSRGKKRYYRRAVRLLPPKTPDQSQARTSHE